MKSFKPFDGLQVVDLSTILAGPAVGTFFSELGAFVTKFENPLTGGDATRSWKLSTERQESNVSAYFSSVNFGKKYREVDLNKPDGINEIYRAVKTADIVLLNFKPGDEFKFGLDYERLKSIQPKIIYARLKGFENQSGRPAFDVVLQAETGYMSMNGTSDSGPVKMPVALIDVLAAHQMKEAILIALWQRERTGKGAHIECSLEAAALSGLMNQASNFLMEGNIAKPLGTLHPNIAPYGEYFTGTDGKAVVLAVGNDKQFGALCKLLGANDLPHDVRFASNEERVKNRDSLTTKLKTLIESRNAEDFAAELTEAKVPAGIIRKMDEVMNSAVARKMILTEVIEGKSTQRLSSVAFSFEKED